MSIQQESVPPPSSTRAATGALTADEGRGVSRDVAAGIPPEDTEGT